MTIQLAEAEAVPAQRVREEKRHRRVSLVVGWTCAGLVLATVTVGPTIVHQDPYAINAIHTLAPPSRQHWLGTDELGRDVAARLASGGRVDLTVALSADALATAIAVVLGLLTGFLGGILDLVVTRVVDLFFAIPALLISLGVVGLLGPSATTIVIAVGIAYWPAVTRLIRAEVVSIRSAPYIDAARVMGTPSWQILVRDVIPGVLPLILINSTAIVGSAMLDAASLGFLGLGIQPPHASWGAMLSEGRDLILRDPALGLIAGAPILLTVLAVNILSDELRDRLDARRAGR